MTNRLPDFFVVGAQKAGTTTLHEWLEQSSEIAMPWSKETHFFRDVEKFSNLFISPGLTGSCPV